MEIVQFAVSVYQRVQQTGATGVREGVVPAVSWFFGALKKVTPLKKLLGRT